MQNNTANLNIMIKAARKASKSLIRDFNEIEKLQVVSKKAGDFVSKADLRACLLYTSPSPRDRTRSRMPSSA